MCQAARVQIRPHVIVQVMRVWRRGDVGLGVLGVDAVEIWRIYWCVSIGILDAYSHVVVTSIRIAHRAYMYTEYIC